MSWVDALEDELVAQLNRPKAQPHQLPPPDPAWEAWVLATGRGGGKSFAAMLWLADYAERHPGLRARIIAPTFGDGVASCVEGPNGLLARSPTARWMASAAGGARVEYPNGSMVWVLGTPTPKDADRLRALTNCHVDIFEEAAANPQLKAAVEQAELSRRGKGIPNRWVATTTPRPLKIMRDWAKDPAVHYVRAPSSANAHADQSWLDKLEKTYKGTRLYRQEVLGEIIEDVEGALWTLSDLERSTVPYDDLNLTKIVVGVDPPATVGTCGIVVVGRDAAGHIYVLADYSITNATPNVWARQVMKASEEFGGALVVAEINQGGNMVTSVLQGAAGEDETPPPITTVHASKGKKTRAEPVALRWEAEEQTAHLAPRDPDGLVQLTDQLITWAEGDESPDRLDAMVWAATHLKVTSYPAPTTSVGTTKTQLPGW